MQLRRTDYNYYKRDRISTVSFGPVEAGIRVVEEHPRELLIMSPFEMLRHGRTIRPPTSVTILPLPDDHRVSVLLPLGAHPLTRRSSRPPRSAPYPPRGISHAHATYTCSIAAAWEHFRVFPRSPRRSPDRRKSN